MSKYIIREIEPENAELGYYFEGDCFTDRAGDYCYNLFILQKDYGRYYGFNIDEYKRISEKVESLIDGFDDVENGLTNYDGKRYTYKDILQENGISYNPSICHKFKQWKESAEYDDVETIAEYLTIVTGEKWNTASAYGYCQGDYCEILYCEKYYKDNPQKYGEIYLGAAKEFGVIETDENDEEINSCFGYIVADSEVKTDEDYKKIVCEYAGIDQKECTLEMIDFNNIQHSTIYTYKAM